MISLPVLLRSAIDDTDNLQHLMSDAIKVWNSRVCMIVPDTADVGTSAWRWALKAGQLILQTPRFRVRMAQSRPQLPDAGGFRLPLLEEVRSRADRFGIPLTSLRMVVIDRHIGYGALGHDISDDTQLDGISDALGQAEGVLEADARVPSGATLQCVFGSGIASARGTRTQIRLDELFGTTARLLSDLTDHESAKIDELLGAQGPPPEQPWRQPSLDDA